VDAFLIVDFQNDFTPGGALPVPEGDAIAEDVNSLLERFPLVVATRDWHPPGHGSFVDSDIDRSRWCGTDPPGIWPVHCVQGTPGAELHPSLDAENVDVVLDKGQDLYSQGYSAFQDTELGELLRDAGVERLYVAGLATDYCVRQSVLDALERGFEVVVVEDAIRGVDVEPGDSARAIEEMRAAGARLERAAEIEPLEPA
jgi:nicotinamidase/pyrazinamidase